MTARTMVKAILPPALTGVLRRLRPQQAPAPPEWVFLADGWRDAGTGVRGWNVESVAATQRRKWARFLQLVEGNGPLAVAHEAAVLENEDFAAHAMIMSHGYVAALAARHTDRLSILDWGGGVGHYRVLTQKLLPDVTIDYHCKDLPLLCAAGRELQPDVTFHEDERTCFARRYDLVVACSSLQYSRDWRGTLRALADVADGWLFVTRLPLVRATASFAVLQRPNHYGYDTEYVGWFLNRDEFLSYAGGLGVELVREFLVGESPRVANAPEHGRYGGFLFHRIQPLPCHD